MAHICAQGAVMLRASAAARPATVARAQPVMRALACRRQQQQQPRRQRALRVCASTEAEAPSSFAQAKVQPVLGADGQAATFPGVPAVYAIYDKDGTLQYVGLTRKVNLSVAQHLESLPELVGSVKFEEVPGGDRESLTAKWKEWVSEAVQETGSIPPGNAPGETKWQAKRPRAAKPEIRLTPGKGLQDLTCSVEDLIDAVVKTNKVVAFVKGTRTSPSCGFSYRVLTILNEIGADYEVVDVLDEVYNPGVRDTIKTYSQWPTIPQIYINGEFIGGADIVDQMYNSGELQRMLKELK